MKGKNSIINLIFICMILVFVTVVCISGCGNQAIFDPGNFSFTHIHITDGVEGHCLDVDKWWDNDRGIEVRAKDGKALFCSEGTYQLFESSNNCPYCR